MTQQRADRIVDGAERVNDVIDTTSLHANLVNNSVKAARERSGGGVSLTDGSVARGLLWWALARNTAGRGATAAGAAPAGAR